MKKTDKMKSLYLRLLKAWTKGKQKKAVKLQHELLEMELSKHK